MSTIGRTPYDVLEHEKLQREMRQLRQLRKSRNYWTALANMQGEMDAVRAGMEEMRRLLAACEETARIGAQRRVDGN